VCDKHVERWDKILDKIDACTARIRARQAQITGQFGGCGMSGAGRGTAPSQIGGANMRVK